MTADHWLAREMSKKLQQPILRFFTWNPYCISLGYHQNEKEINSDLCQQHHIDVVRRPTGGRAILHAEELTYSVVYPFHDLDVSSVYRLIHQPFVAALQDLNIPAEFQATQADFRNYYKTDQAAVCFGTSARYEVEINGKKLIGSAQRVYEHSILQHGSLLIGAFHEQMVDYLNINEQKKEKLRKYIQQHTCYLQQYSENISADMLAESIESQFKKLFEIRFIPLSENRGLNNDLNQISANQEFQIWETQAV